MNNQQALYRLLASSMQATSIVQPEPQVAPISAFKLYKKQEETPAFTTHQPQEPPLAAAAAENMSDFTLDELRTKILGQIPALLIGQGTKCTNKDCGINAALIQYFFKNEFGDTKKDTSKTVGQTQTECQEYLP